MSWLGKLFGKKSITMKANVVVLGSSGAGKTTLIRFLETGEPVLEDPRTTLGIDIRQTPIKVDGWALSAIDVGGQELYRDSLWGLGVSQADAVIYVIDSLIEKREGDARFESSKFAFDYMLNLVQTGIPILILMNKQDLTNQNPLSCKDAINVYGIDQLVGRSFNILPSSAKFGDGVEFAMEWLVDKIMESK